VNEKARLRREVLARREVEPDRETRSARIRARLEALPDYASARVIAAFVGVGSEVDTLPAIRTALDSGRRMAVPSVVAGRLVLTLLRDVAELEPAPFGLQEPPAGLRNDPGRQVAPEDVDFFVVPGVAFDPEGGRLGHGKGYYDGLLRLARPDASRTAVAFECQIVARVPMTERDVRMHQVVTETRLMAVGRQSSHQASSRSRS
jgi:5-formyltetrahydrofolate cyclo-ligase